MKIFIFAIFMLMSMTVFAAWTDQNCTRSKSVQGPAEVRYVKIITVVQQKTPKLINACKVIMERLINNTTKTQDIYSSRDTAKCINEAVKLIDNYTKKYKFTCITL
jgi:hypothetical protein